MKKIFLLLALLLCTSMDWAHATVVKVGGIYYSIDQSNKTAQVTSNYELTGALCKPQSISVKGTIYVVTSLGQSCFYGCTGLTSIIIPNSVTSMGIGCFSV